jgi:hypothetical protein
MSAATNTSSKEAAFPITPNPGDVAPCPPSRGGKGSVASSNSGVAAAAAAAHDVPHLDVLRHQTEASEENKYGDKLAMNRVNMCHCSLSFFQSLLSQLEDSCSSVSYIYRSELIYKWLYDLTHNWATTTTTASAAAAAAAAAAGSSFREKREQGIHIERVVE